MQAAVMMVFGLGGSWWAKLLDGFWPGGIWRAVKVLLNATDTPTGIGIN